MDSIRDRTRQMGDSVTGLAPETDYARDITDDEPTLEEMLAKMQKHDDLCMCVECLR